MKPDLTIYTDGGARGNPGPAAIGVVVYLGGEVLTTFGKYIGKATNNVAEYSAVLAAIKYLLTLDSVPGRIQFYLDSLLVAEQLSGTYKTKKEDLKKLLADVKRGEGQLNADISYSHIPREENRVADAIVNKVLDAHLFTK